MGKEIKKTPVDVDIQAFIDNELDAYDMQAMVEMLSGDAGCLKRYEQLLRQKKLLRFLYGQGACH